MATATKKPPAATPPAENAAPGGIKKINLGALTTTAKKEGGTAYPVMPDPDKEVAGLVADIINETREMEALDGSLTVKKAELRGRASTFFFEHLHGRHEIPSSVECKNGESSLLVTFQNRYKAIADETEVTSLLGEERTAQFFRQQFELKIDGDKLPAAHAEAIIAALHAVLVEHGAADALTAKALIKPTADFHTARHSSLTIEENQALELVCPIVAMVKTKGRKKE